MVYIFFRLSLFLQRRFLASLMFITMTGFAIVMVYASSYHRNEFKAVAYASIHNNSAGRKTSKKGPPFSQLRNFKKVLKKFL